MDEMGHGAVKISITLSRCISKRFIMQKLILCCNGSCILQWGGVGLLSQGIQGYTLASLRVWILVLLPIVKQGMVTG